YADINVLRHSADNRPRIKNDPPDALFLTGVAVRISRIILPIANRSEARNLGPGSAAIGALPQAERGIGISRGSEIDDVAVVRVHRQALAIAATGHVAANLERERGSRPRVALVGALQDSSVIRVP